MCIPIYYKNNNVKNKITYPTGEFIVEVQEVIEAMAYEIDNILDDKNRYILFLCRGVSGHILAGGVAGALYRKGYKEMSIHVSRKATNCHSITRSICYIENNKITTIVIDDFIASGDTVNKIIEEFNHYYPNIAKLDILCTTNIMTTDESSENNIICDLRSNFKYHICCSLQEVFH